MYGLLSPFAVRLQKKSKSKATQKDGTNVEGYTKTVKDKATVEVAGYTKELDESGWLHEQEGEVKRSCYD